MPEYVEGLEVHAAPFTDSSLRVHHNPEARPDTILVFVHGWSGYGYDTWGSLIQEVYSLEPHVAVGAFDYVSGKRRTLSDSPNCDTIVENLVDELSDLQYPNVYIVAHSMGGVIAAAAIRSIYSDRVADQPAAERIGGLISIASPHAGTKFVQRQWSLFKDTEYLHLHSTVADRNAEFFASDVEIDMSKTLTSRPLLPHFAVTSTGDRIVDKFSSRYIAPREQRLLLRGTHTSILRNKILPTWIHEKTSRITQVRQTRTTTASRSVSSAGNLSTSFRGDARHSDWEDCYLDVIQEFEDANGIDVSIMDVEDGLIHLLMRIVPLPELALKDTQKELRRDAEDQVQGRVLTYGVASFGVGATNPLEEFHMLIGNRKGRWYAACSTGADLRSEMHSWLARCHRFMQHSASRESPILELDGEPL